MTTPSDRPASGPSLLGPFEGMRKGKKLKLREFIIVVILAVTIAGLIVYQRCMRPQEENAPTVRPRAPRRTTSTGEPQPRTVQRGLQKTMDADNAVGSPDPLVWNLDAADAGGLPSGLSCGFPGCLPGWPGAEAAGIE